MSDEDRILEDKMRDAFLKKTQVLQEVAAQFSLLSRQAPTPFANHMAKFSEQVIRNIKDLYDMQLQQIEATNKQARTIIKIRQDIELLKSEIKNLKK